MIDESEEGKRVYSEIPKIVHHIDSIIEDLKEKLDYEETGEEEEEKLACLADALIDRSKADEARNIIRETIEIEEWRKRVKNQKLTTFEEIKKARTGLTVAFLSIREDSIKEGVNEQLALVEEYLNKLKKWADG